MEEVLISVIIPVYNVETYLTTCVEGVLSQTYKNLEIILVDDGSIDNSGRICDEFKEKDDRIIVIHKNNGGLSDARNAGMKVARGEFITFIDSDDDISTELINHLYSILKDYNVQISICSLVHLYPNTMSKYTKATYIKRYSVEDALCEMMYQKSFLFSACGKLYKKSLFDDIVFPAGMFFEDVAIMFHVFSIADAIVYSNAKLYGYLHRENSITTSKFSIRDCDILKISNEQLEFAKYYSKKVYRAAIAYQTVGALRVFLNAPGEAEFKESVIVSKNIIDKNAFTVIGNHRCRSKLKISLVLYKISTRLMKKIYNHVDRWK